MQRTAFFVYGVLCHLLFLAVFTYMAAFFANVLVPKTIDSGPEGPFGSSLAINIGLLIGFGLQHSVMARPTFKRWWTRFVPEPIERSTYVLASNLAVVAMLWWWQPMTATVWNLESDILRTLAWCGFGLGWLSIVLTSFLIHHFDLMGTRQVYLHLRGQAYTPPTFRRHSFYRLVRHPLYVGWMLALWVTPTMSAGHLLFASGSSVYILVAILFEERNLMDEHREYAEYRESVPMLIPFAKTLGPRSVKG